MIHWAAHRPAVIWAFAVGLIAAGAVAFTRLPLATKTQVELPRLRITSSWSGASPELVEAYVTSPIESAIQPVRGVRKTSSESSDQSRITVELDPGVDVTMTRLAILERLELLRPEFPVGVTQPAVSNFVPEELNEQPLLRYTIAGPYTPGALRRIVAEEIEPRLSTVPGVAGVAVGGGAETGIAVSYDAVQLRRLGLRPEALAVAIRDARQVQALGLDRDGQTQRPVMLRDQPRVMEDLALLPVRGPGGRVFQLGELADIRQEEDSRGQFNRINGRTAVTMTLSRLPGADAIRTAKRVKAEITAMQPGLPAGLRFQLESDDSLELAQQLRDLALRGCLAFAAVLLVLSLLLRHARSVVLVMGSAAVAIAGTSLSLYLLKIPANLLTLAGLGMGIGILVQNGLIVVERLRGVKDEPAARAAAGARIFPAVAGATLTTAVVLFPFLYLQGNARAAFVPFAAAFALALFWSVVASVIMIPAVGAGRGHPSNRFPRLSRVYDWIVVRVLLRWRYGVIGLTTAALAVLGWGFAKRVERVSWSGFGGQRTTVNVSVSFPRGSDPESLDRAMREFESIAIGQAGVAQVRTQGFIGRANMVVEFAKEYTYSAIPAIMQDELTQRAVLVGGARVSVYGQGPGFSSGGGGATVAFRIKLLGYSFEGVRRFAEDLALRLEAIPRVRNVNINASSFWGQERTLNVAMDPDRPAMARAGVTAQQFAAAVAREVRGQQGGTRIELEGEEVIVSLKAKGARERSLDELREAIVPNPTDAPVRFADLASVDEREGLSMIQREDQQYVRIVSYDFRGPARLAQRTHDAFMASISVPPGYSAEDQQFAWGRDESGKGLWLVFAAGLILVILAVAVVFDSAWTAALVFMSLPIAISGVAGIFWATGTAFGREAAVGLILVIGLAVNQTILLVDAALARRTVGQADRQAVRSFRKLGARDVLSATRDRAGMIVLVSLTTLASLLPLAARTDLDSLFGSIALATVGGTVAGTFGALFVVPALLPGFRRRGRSGRWWRRPGTPGVSKV